MERWRSTIVRGHRYLVSLHERFARGVGWQPAVAGLRRSLRAVAADPTCLNPFRLGRDWKARPFHHPQLSTAHGGIVQDSSAFQGSSAILLAACDTQYRCIQHYREMRRRDHFGIRARASDGILRHARANQFIALFNVPLRGRSWATSDDCTGRVSKGSIFFDRPTSI